MSKSFCRLGFANGSVDDGAVSGRAIDGGELIIDFAEMLAFRLLAEFGCSVTDNELINRIVVGFIVIFGRCVVLAIVDGGVVDDDVVVVMVVVVVVGNGDADDDDDTNGNCICSISGLMMASNKNDNRKTTQ